mgnify:CR=1 FL=1
MASCCLVRLVLLLLPGSVSCLLLLLLVLYSYLRSCPQERLCDTVQVTACQCQSWSPQWLCTAWLTLPRRWEGEGASASAILLSALLQWSASWCFSYRSIHCFLALQVGTAQGAAAAGVPMVRDNHSPCAPIQNVPATLGTI